MNKCKICESDNNFLFKMKVLNKYVADYSLCQNCNFIHANNPFWLDEAYSNVITDADTGIVARNIKFSKLVLTFIYFFKDYKKKFLDFAGGYGLFTNIMRNFGINYYHIDPLCNNIFSKDWEIKKINKRYEAITAFEYFEHSINPIKDFKSLLRFTNTLIFSTETHKFSNNVDKKWFYFFPKYGQHISLFSIKSIQKFADTNKLNYYSNNKNFHILTKNKIKNKFLLKTIFIYYEFYYLFIRKKLK